MAKQTDAERRTEIFNRCLKECETVAAAFALACDVEGFIELGLEPPDTVPTVSREKAREEVLRLTLEGVKPRAIKNTLGLSKDVVYRHILALRKLGALPPAKGNGLAETRTGSVRVA